MEQEISSDDARRRWRELLNAVEHDGEHVTVMRYGHPAVVIVPVEWHETVSDPSMNGTGEA